MTDNFDFLKRRQPPTPLDRDNLDAVNPAAAIDPKDLATPEEIAGRKILRIKRPGAVETSNEIHKPNILSGNGPMFGNLPAAGASTAHTAALDFRTVPVPAVQTGGFFSTLSDKPASNFFLNNQSSNVSEKPKTETPVVSTGSLFFNKVTPTDKEPSDLNQFFKTQVGTTDAKTLFSNNTATSAATKASPQKQKPEVHAPAPVAQQTGGLFASLNAQVTAPTQPSKVTTTTTAAASNYDGTGSFFKTTTESHQTTTPAVSSLFGNSGPTPVVHPAPVKTAGFFKDSTQPTTTTAAPPVTKGFFNTESQPVKTTGLFDNLTASVGSTEPAKTAGFFGDAVKTKSGLFDGLLNPSASNNTGCGTNLFGSTVTPLSGMFSKNTQGGDADDDEEAVGADEDEVPGQDIVSDPTKSTGTYKYESLSESLFADNVLNFKTDKGMGAGHLSVEKVKNNKNILLVFRNGAKVVLYQGTLLPGLSKVEFLKGRQDALNIMTGVMKDGKLSVQPAKIQFSDDKAAALAKQTLEGLLVKSAN